MGSSFAIVVVLGRRLGTSEVREGRAIKQLRPAFLAVMK
jgi:hypothetical protein